MVDTRGVQRKCSTNSVVRRQRDLPLAARGRNSFNAGDGWPSVEVVSFLVLGATRKLLLEKYGSVRPKKGCGGAHMPRLGSAPAGLPIADGCAGNAHSLRRFPLEQFEV
jgi:hypothetical protein